MSDHLPRCQRCSALYSTPVVYPENQGLCESCRPVKLCKSCKGRGDVWNEPKPNKKSRIGHWSRCAACNGTRHEPRARAEHAEDGD